ncbi:hypothetical protein COL41_04190 [Bacillus mycoides]|uniref:hypothetical protein n=1 Tax=Bacillus mycoides TaxID=1405 RepID=UPI000BF83AA7|nr:hypothetical protein [Bacillus mycoides]PFX98199.1 hypothetical protein COL41_04190 [Bacillus mycoides]QWH03515.1 hypothetical protein EXW52_26415 [Bacillus mycoides]
MNLQYLIEPNLDNKFKIRINYAILLFLSTFAINETVRSIFTSESGNLNVLFLITGVSFFLYSLKKRKINWLLFCLVSILSFSLVLSLIYVFEYASSYKLYTLVNLILPLYLLAIQIDKQQALKGLRLFLKGFNFLIFTLLLIGIIDFVTNSSIQLKLANTILKDNELGFLMLGENRGGIYRYFSFLGHPLTNAKYFLLFFVMNSIYAYKVKYLINKYLLIFISLIGLILSGSKTALLLFVILMLISNESKKKKIFYYMVIVIALLALYNSEIFQQNLLQRYIESYNNGDISNGRNELLQLLFQSNVPMPSFWHGGGANFSREISMMLGGNAWNFEYSFVMLAYDYGILAFVLLYTCIFIYPVTILILRKEIYLLINFLVVTIMFNSNNGLAALSSDSMSQLCIVILFFIAISHPTIERK